MPIKMAKGPIMPGLGAKPVHRAPPCLGANPNQRDDIHDNLGA